MRIRKRSHLRRKNAVIVCVGLLPMVVLGAYAGFIGYLGSDLASFSYEMPVNPEVDFAPLASINASRLDAIADQLEWRLDAYHTAINLTISAAFNATTGAWVSNGSTDNGALWTGTALAAECMRYSVLADGSPAKDNSSKLVHKLVSGMANLLRIPNGGLGPEYPGMLARFYAAPEDKPYFSWMFADQYKHFNGSGDYSQWRVRLYTSKDEIGGYLLGLAAAQHFITDDAWVQDTLKLMIAQLANGFLDTFWQEMHGDGTPCGAQLNPLFGGGNEWKLLVMKLAANAYPENVEYQRLYNYYAAKDTGLLNANTNGDFNTLDEYYAYNFGHDVYFGLVLAEDTPALRDKYIRNYENSYRVWENHRNAWINVVYLAMCALRSGTTAAYNLTRIKWDVLDQLWWFNRSNSVPIDSSYGGDGNATTRTSLGGDWVTVDPKIAKWQNFFYNTPFGSWFRWIPDQLFPGLLSTRYVKAARADMYEVSSFAWGKSPFTTDGTDTGNFYGGNGKIYINEESGTTFTAPYWALRAFGYISATEVIT